MLADAATSPIRRWLPGVAAAKSKSVISLLSRKPAPGTVIPLPASCSMVLV